MIKEVTAVNFLQNLGEMLNHVVYANDNPIVKHGEPVAALAGIELFARARRMRDRFDAPSNRITEKAWPR
jgi:hypothetical protein